MENSIERDIHLLESYAGMTHKMTDNQGRPKLDQAIEHILSDYKRILKENEKLKHKIEGQECVIETQAHNEEVYERTFERLEKKEIELINENEHYKDLIYALKTYYDITEEDLEKCMKNDR